MTKEVDALVLIGHNHLIASEAPHYTHEDVEHGLWYVRTGKKKWATKEPITESDRTNLYAGEVLLSLGRLTSTRYYGQEVDLIRDDNPFKVTTLEIIDDLSPLDRGEVLNASITTEWPEIEQGLHGLPTMFDEALAREPSIEDELTEKWTKAKAVHARRGTVAIMAYNTDDLIQGLSKVDMDQVAPDTVEFDDDANVLSEEHNLNGLVARTGLKAHLAEVPYYSTFSDRKNGAEMLSSALEDLKLVATVIGS